MAFYLPQFHQIPENDAWWGKGFTEWESTKKAKPLFTGHNQPRIPLHNNYYHLLEKRTMEWQAELAKKHGVYGFCIYHYWFGEKQLLEKPAENLLKWKDININYCFSWANESWIPSWSNLKGNAWKQQTRKVGLKHNKYLVKQTYGREEEWKRHFLYLLPFFQDERYIKIDNAPVFIIYKPGDMYCLRAFMQYWNQLAKENGFHGIYFVGTSYKKWKEKHMNAMLLYEPSYTLSQEYQGKRNKAFIVPRRKNKMCAGTQKYPQLLNYRFIWRKILSRKNHENIWPGGFVDYDDTPRRGGQGVVCAGNTVRYFRRYIKRLVHKNRGKEFVFLTAWNEWGEGACLEPDHKHGYAYLQAIKESVK